MKDWEARKEIQALEKQVDRLQTWMMERDEVLNALLDHLKLATKKTTTVLVPKEGGG